MSALDIIGPIVPWPREQTPIAVREHKSRMLLQATALRALRDRSVEEGIMMHALERGAAELELWLLDRSDESAAEREQRAHSAITLAQRAGDWLLVERILDEQRDAERNKRRGGDRKRTPIALRNMPKWWVEAREAHNRSRPSFDHAGRVLFDHLSQLMDPGSAEPRDRAAIRVLAERSSLAQSGGPAASIWAVAQGALALDDSNTARELLFAACVSSPTNEHHARHWVLSLPVGDPSSLALVRALSGFFASAHTAAVSLNWLVDLPAIEEHELDLQIESCRAFMDDASAMNRDFARVAIARALIRRSRAAEALAILSSAAQSDSATPVAAVFFLAAAAHQRDEATLDVARATLLSSRSWIDDNSMRRRPKIFWIAGQTFAQIRDWESSIAVFERADRGAIREEWANADAVSLNDYGVALAHLDRVDEARAAFERALSLAPSSDITRTNLASLDAKRPLDAHTVGVVDLSSIAARAIDSGLEQQRIAA